MAIEGVRRWLGASLAVVGVVGLAFWLGSRDRDPAPGDDVGPSSGSSQDAPRGAPAPKEETAPGLAGSSRAPPKTEEPPAAPGPEAVVPTRHVLELYLIGVDGQSEERIQVRVLAESGGASEDAPKVEVSLPYGPVLLVDTSAHFTRARPARLFVLVDHPRFFPERGDVVTSDGPAVPDAPGNGKRIVDRLYLRMRPAARVGGRVVDDRSGPIIGATVSLHAMRSNVPDPEATEAVTTGKDGTFRVRARDAGEYLLVAAAPAFRPAGRVVAAKRGELLSVDDVPLGRGLEISGRVTWAGKPLKASIRAVQGDEDRITTFLPGEVGVGRFVLLWKDGAATYKRAVVMTNEDGTYAFGGLDPTRYVVGVDPYATEGLPLHSSVTSSLTRSVSAPDVALDFALDGAEVVFEVTSSERPLVGFVNVFGTGGASGYATDENGRRSVLVRAMSRLQISTTPNDDTFEADQREIDAPRVGERAVVRIVLERKANLGGVTLTLSSKTKMPSRAAVSFFTGEERLIPVSTKSVEGSGGVFHVPDVPAGTYTVIVQADSRTWMSGEGFFLEAEGPIVVTKGLDVAASFEIRPGGRLRVFAHDIAGKLVPATCDVRDPLGRSVARRFLYPPYSSTWGQLSSAGPSLLDPPLEAGVYSLVLEREGYKSKTVSARVEAGKVSEVDVFMLKE